MNTLDLRKGAKVIKMFRDAREDNINSIDENLTKHLSGIIDKNLQTIKKKSIIVSDDVSKEETDKMFKQTEKYRKEHPDEFAEMYEMALNYGKTPAQRIDTTSLHKQKKGVKVKQFLSFKNKEGKLLVMGTHFDILTPYNLLKYTNETDKIHNFYKYTDGKDYEDFGRVTFEVVEKLENCKLII